MRFGRAKDEFPRAWYRGFRIGLRVRHSGTVGGNETFAFEAESQGSGLVSRGVERRSDGGRVVGEGERKGEIESESDCT